MNNTLSTQDAAVAAENQTSETPAAAGKRRLDLSRLDPPADLEESSIEEMTIDGICGVY
jgi:mycofactocin precursor